MHERVDFFKEPDTISTILMPWHATVIGRLAGIFETKCLVGSY